MRDARTSTGDPIELSARTRWLAYVIGASGLGINNAMAFLIPLRARELGAGFEVIGIIVASTAIVPVLSSVPLGTVVDRFGARRSFVLGMGLCAAVAASAILLGNYWGLLVVQVLFGAARALGWIGAQTYITGLGRPSDRASLTGRFSFFGNIGTMVTPLAAGAMSQLIGFRLAFLFVAVYGMAFVGIGLLLPAVTAPVGDRSTRTREVGLAAAARLLTIRGMQVVMTLSFVRIWISKLWTAFFPVYLLDLGIGAGVAGSVLSARGLIASLLAPTAGYWCRFVRPPTVAVVGLGAGALGLILSPHLTAVPEVYAASALVGIGSGLSLPMLLTIISDATPAGQRGMALGLRQMGNNIAAGGAPLIIGPLVTMLGALLAFTAGGIVALGVLAGATALHLWPRHLPRPWHAGR